MDKKEALKNIKLFVLDMDGTFYLGNRILEGSLEFLKKVEETGRKFIFFTNNSSKTPDDYVKKLAKMNCFVKKEDILTSGNVTIEYLKSFYDKKSVYLMGTPALAKQFKDSGVILTEDMPDVVVVAFDMTLTYEKLEKACTYIRNGAKFLATHLDINCPTESGFIPDCGAMCAAISLSTGKEPKYLGKPFGETLEMILKVTGISKNEIAFVGDRLYTDVATGVNNNAAGFLVLSGETKLEDLDKFNVIPTCIFDSIGKWLNIYN